MSPPVRAPRVGSTPRRLLAGVLLLTLLALGAPAAAWAPAASAATGEDEAPDVVDGPPDGLAVELTDIAPAILEPGQDLTLTGTVTNHTAEPVERPTLRLRMQRSTPISRSALERWLDPDVLWATTLVAVEESEEPLAPGAARPFTLTVPADSLPLSETYVAWGPRGIEITATDGADAGVMAGSDRSFLLWWPDVEVTPTPIAVLAGAVPTTAERIVAGDTTASLAEAAAPRLGPLVDALARRDVDLALDPALLGARTPGGATDRDGATTPPAEETPDDAASPGGSGPSTGPEPEDEDGDGDATPSADPGSAGPTITTTPPGTETGTEAPPTPDPTPGNGGAELLAALADAPRAALHALPWGDADVAALAHAERTDLLEGAREQTRAALRSAGLDAGTGLAWPVSANPDLATVRAAAAAGARAVVLPSDAVEATDRLTYTPTGRAMIDVGEREVPAVLADERLSAILGGAHRRVNGDGEPDVPLDDLTARQFLLAESAVINRERPTDGRGLLLTLPRDFAGDADALAARLDVLAAAPWVQRVGVMELASRPAPELEREPLPELAVEPGEIDAGALRVYTRTLESTQALASTTPEPQRILAPIRVRLLETLSAAWRSAPDERRDRLAAAAAAAAARASAVAAQPGSSLLLINDEAHLPVSVTNDLEQSVSVQVRLEPRGVRLVAEEAVALEIPAQQSATAQVPVHAVGSGDVVVDVLLESPTGELIGEPTEIQVRVRADWEDVGTAIAAGVLLVLFVVGLVRTVRRGRRRAADGTAGPATTVTGGTS